MMKRGEMVWRQAREEKTNVKNTLALFESELVVRQQMRTTKHVCGQD